jgi:hypothetical protein
MQTFPFQNAIRHVITNESAECSWTLFFFSFIDIFDCVGAYVKRRTQVVTVHRMQINK